jgi:hypothetical protein
MNTKLKIICDGDSWVFGSEIIDPNINTSDWESDNDEYRLPKIFPNYLSKLLDADIINLAWPADDNTTILNRTITYITSNYLSKGISTDNLFVIVGWSSPERNSFWYDDGRYSSKFRLWPQNPQVDTPNQGKIWELYVQYLWNQEEYLPRYVMNVLQLQNFCNVHNIKWMCFNSFYQTPNSSPTDWKDLNIELELKKINVGGCQYNISDTLGRLIYAYDYSSVWDMIDSVRFYKKNQQISTFKSFMESKKEKPIYSGWHPSPNSHKLWANELHHYIIENNLL